MTMGRVAVEKNIEAFSRSTCPDRRSWSATGRSVVNSRRNFLDVHFLGEKKGEDLTAHVAAADVFVFPSLTDTFGVVQLEALACGTPVAAFPVTGPIDVISDHPIGALDEDLRAACLRALTMSREGCRNFALERSWENSARQFIGNLVPCNPTGRSGCAASQPKVTQWRCRVESKADRLRQRNEKAIMAESIKLDDAAHLDFDREMVEQAYDRWAPIYDLVFGGVFSKGRDAAIQATNKLGGRVLEVGVGTGISLPLYAPHVRLFGTDISEAMLNKARKRVAEQKLEECRRARGDGRREARIRRQFLRRRDGAICRHRRAKSGSGAGRIRPRAAARRRTDHPDPRQRR